MSQPINLVVSIDAGPLLRFAGDIGRLHQTAEGHAMYRRWAARYMGFARRRFIDQSRGAGVWPPLKPATVKRRRKGGRSRGGNDEERRRSAATGGNVSILIDTGMLVNQLDVAQAENQQIIENGVRVGFLSQSPHVGTSTKGRDISVSEIAAIHHFGLGALPERRIIVAPAPAVAQAMVGDMRWAIGRLIARHGRP